MTIDWDSGEDSTGEWFPRTKYVFVFARFCFCGSHFFVLEFLPFNPLIPLLEEAHFLLNFLLFFFLSESQDGYTPVATEEELGSSVAAGGWMAV